MPVGAAAGTPQYSGIFIPEIWSKKLLVKFYEATCLSDICNTDYEGEIKDVGDKVIIRTVPTITIRNYTKNSTLIHQRPESANVDLNIDKAKYFDFICDDIDKHQTDIQLMETFSNDASEQMQIVVERDDVFANIYVDAHADNVGSSAGAISGDIDMGVTGTPLELTKTNILDKLVDCRTVLNEQNVPRNSRWAILPAAICGMIMKSDLKDASLAGDGTSIIRNGRLGQIAEFTIYDSNTLTSVTDTTTCFHALVGQKSALSFAAQMTKTESLRAESTFGSIVRGLNVYGYEVLKPEALIDFYITKVEV